MVAKQDAVHNSVILLDLLSWMCDGQNKKMQDMLRKQDTGLNVSCSAICALHNLFSQ